MSIPLQLLFGGTIGGVIAYCIIQLGVIIPRDVKVRNKEIMVKHKKDCYWVMNAHKSIGERIVVFSQSEYVRAEHCIGKAVMDWITDISETTDKELNANYKRAKIKLVLFFAIGIIVLIFGIYFITLFK